MKHWKDQAQKNNLTIIETGNCQLCGAKLSYGIEECVATAATIGNKLAHEDAIHQMTLFLTVDSHALQHSEIHGRWNNHFHLTRLHLILHDGIQWTYNFSTLLSLVLDQYKKSHIDETIIVPMDRGKSTVAEVSDTDDTKIYVKEIYSWAHEVYQSFSHGHDIAINVSNAFKKRLS